MTSGMKPEDDQSTKGSLESSLELGKLTHEAHKVPWWDFGPNFNYLATHGHHNYTIIHIHNHNKKLLIYLKRTSHKNTYKLWKEKLQSGDSTIKQHHLFFLLNC